MIEDAAGDTFDSNVSARAHAWLLRSVATFDADLWHGWWHALQKVVNGGPRVIWTEPWPHDYWVAQGVQYPPHGSDPIQIWRHEGALNAWPLLESASQSTARAGGQTNSAALDQILAASEPLAYEHHSALGAFTAYRGSAENGGGPESVSPPPLFELEIVPALVSSILGTALAGLIFAPTEDEVLLQNETRRRLDLVLQLPKAPHLAQAKQMDLAYEIEALYTARWDGGRPALAPTQRGETIESRDRWYWVSRPLRAKQVRDSIRIAAKLLVCPPVLRTILSTIREENETSLLSLCVLRRWALGLRTAAWLEEAVSYPWRDIRVSDLVSFAYASIGPWWPRPSIAVSHRSMDAKSHLKELTAWRNAHVAIDAMVIPNWESNTGFVWRLFAATPAIVRIRTDNYGASTWCRREAELAQYLLDHSDFLGGRVIADVSLSHLDETVHALLQPGTISNPKRLLKSLQNAPDFPPLTLVLDVPSQPEFILNLMAAVCTLRLLYGLIGDIRTVNAIAVNLCRGERLDLPAPTNAPDGWTMHSQVFEFLARHMRTDQPPIQLAPGYPDQQRTIDIKHVVDCIPDLSSGIHRSLDLLAALEWNREIRRWFSERWGSNRAVVDCRELREEDWSLSPTHSLKRGMIALRTETLVFVVQNAGQSVEDWLEIGGRDSPILTQHVSGQLRWMTQALTLPTWIAAYVSLPDFVFHEEIVHAALEALADEFAAKPGLRLPTEYSDVFVIPNGPDDPFSELARLSDREG